MSDGTRCFLCAGRALEPTGRRLLYPGGMTRRFALACGFCGMLCDEGIDREAARAHLTQALAGERFRPDPLAPYGMDAYTLRSAATLPARAAEPADEAQGRALLAPHGEDAAEARLSPLSSLAPAGVALGVMCRSGDVERLIGETAVHLRWARSITILADGPHALAESPDPRIRVERAALEGDFARQRNRLQAMSPEPWILQLDSDETLDPEEGRLLPALAALADRDGAVSIGLPRRNLVDGALADLFPDTQYRLNRQEVRFAGRVHERPERPWQRSLLAFCAAIRHHLPRAHVERRSAAYEALSPGQGRPQEREALLTPYRP